MCVLCIYLFISFAFLYRVKCEDCTSPWNLGRESRDSEHTHNAYVNDTVKNEKTECGGPRLFARANKGEKEEEEEKKGKKIDRMRVKKNVCRKLEMRPFGYILLSKIWHFMNYVKSTWMSLSRAHFFQCCSFARGYIIAGSLSYMFVFVGGRARERGCVCGAYMTNYSLCMPWWRARQRQQTLFISAFLQFIRIQLNRCISFAIQPFLVRSYHFGMRLCRWVCVCALYVCIHFKQFLSDMHVVFFSADVFVIANATSQNI